MGLGAFSLTTFIIINIMAEKGIFAIPKLPTRAFFATGIRYDAPKTASVTQIVT